MREIACEQITSTVAQLCVEAACDLPADVECALLDAREREESEYGHYALEKICDNITIARESGVPICQDTGLAVVFADIGQDARIVGGSFEAAVNEGIARGYERGYLRMSMVADPLLARVNTGDNTPAVIHTRIVDGDALTLTLMPKGGGSENMSRLAMLAPAAGTEGVRRFVVGSVVSAGGNPCPPTIVGVGIGGNAEAALALSKRALLRDVGTPHPDAGYAALEAELLSEINRSGIGPQGFGGRVTALAVHIETAPTHIATLPVGVTLGCHVSRHKSATL